MANPFEKPPIFAPEEDSEGEETIERDNFTAEERGRFSPGSVGSKFESTPERASRTVWKREEAEKIARELLQEEYSKNQLKVNPEGKAEKKREERRKEEHENSVEAGARWILGMLEKNQKYGERIPLTRDRDFDLAKGITELPGDAPQLARSASQMEYSQKGLYALAKEIREKHPELRFSFKLDPEGKWIEYSVQKQHLSIGDNVNWENNGSFQWREPKKIESIQKDPQSKRKYALFEGGKTGIPLDELVLTEKK